MKFTQAGGWTVGTPLYIGSSADVSLAERCPHETYVADLTERRDQTLIVKERCLNCVATRVKYRPLGEGENP